MNNNLILKRRFSTIWTILKCDSLDGCRPGSDNETGGRPFIAPMKTNLLKFVEVKKKRRSGVAFLFCVSLTLLVFQVAAGQVKDNKHITAIQLGGAAEGSRVTVVSDSPLIDYEAFRRGDRFYVKIPTADLSAAAPHFRADGFEDVQVQKVGDSQIVSFKLQPGATARVDQRGNRLDVVFSAANKVLLNSGNASGARERDAAGPMPSDAAVSRGRTVNVREEAISSSDPRWQAYPNASSNKTGTNPLSANVATASASPLSSPASVLSPGNPTAYQPLSTTTPIAQSRPSPTNTSASSGSLKWGNRLAAARHWVAANRLATLLGALILLSLIVYLVIFMRRRRETAAKNKQAKTPKVQPRYIPGNELEEISDAGTQARESRQDNAAAKPFSRPPAVALTRPTIVSPTIGHDEHIREEEEREVFEL